MRRLLILALLLAACDTRRGEDPAVSWAVGRLEQDTKTAGSARDPTFACTAIQPTVAELEHNPKVGPKYREQIARAVSTCRRALTGFVEARLADAARRGTPPAVECLDVDRALALLGKMGGVDVAPSVHRRNTLCP